MLTNAKATNHSAEQHSSAHRCETQCPPVDPDTVARAEPSPGEPVPTGLRQTHTSPICPSKNHNTAVKRHRSPGTRSNRWCAPLFLEAVPGVPSEVTNAVQQVIEERERESDQQKP